MSESKSNDRRDRRNVLKYGITAIVAGAIAGVGGWSLGGAGAPTGVPVTKTVTTTATKTVTSTTEPVYVLPPPQEATISWLGGGYVIAPELVDMWKVYTNGKGTLEYTPGGISDIPPKVLATGGEGWDICNDISAYMVQILDKAHGGTASGTMPIKPVEIEKLPLWSKTPPENLWPFINDSTWLKRIPPVGEWLTDEALERNAQKIWDGGSAGAATWDGEKWTGGKVIGVPDAANEEGVGYLPEFVPYAEEGGRKKTFDYDETFNPDYAGHMGVQDDPMLQSGWLGQMFAYKNLGELEGWDGCTRKFTRADYDKMIDFMLPYAQDGHIRTFAAEYGAMVTAMSSRELWIMQCWQPVVMASRRAGVPCSWAFTPHGGELWFSPDMASIKTPIMDEVLRFMDWRMQPWWLSLIMSSGYMCPRWNTPDVVAEMGPEQWGWQYNGETTYKDLDGCMKAMWPNDQTYWNAEDNLKNALFVPEAYPWSETEGTPNPQGAIKDHGSADDNFGNIGWISEVPENYTYLIERWTHLKSQLKR